MIRFLLIVNKQGQTRLAKYFENVNVEQRSSMEADIVRKCLSRGEGQCSFFEYMSYKIVYRRYASLFFIAAVDAEENELGTLEFIHCLVETLDKYFENVCELDIMFHLEKTHYIVDEMVLNGCIVEANKTNVLGPILNAGVKL
mmetsp:Transcript_37959/g.97978  ORF Transcript_37959/g.97978 Transcript_37959/m.97978 type:complete len:143 (-) Transcript_37959:1152-1580(-)|eukprot:CAMPEP_0113918572 /NCGR_PEP_ID=MMETSP0780_2-20120614/33437_1 /TAXON_ID=652834 /ORGANISM="Palpitomonas bilix" /LENGTH=142 /DNA_ID=CAMNT_0000918417 /DNA_START=92 /DNA_END=520 /DNA_ORIENTATION=- /assembly_acc=CAM_ASM_000599